MGRYHRKSIRAIIRAFRWWGITFGSIKPFKHPLLFWLRTPPCSLWAFAAGAAAGGYYVWGLPVTCAAAGHLIVALRHMIGA